jgi:hypothetical protein
MRQGVTASMRNLPFPKHRRFCQLKEQRLLTLPLSGLIECRAAVVCGTMEMTAERNEAPSRTLRCPSPSRADQMMEPFGVTRPRLNGSITAFRL